MSRQSASNVYCSKADMAFWQSIAVTTSKPLRRRLRAIFFNTVTSSSTTKTQVMIAVAPRRYLTTATTMASIVPSGRHCRGPANSAILLHQLISGIVALSERHFHGPLSLTKLHMLHSGQLSLNPESVYRCYAWLCGKRRPLSGWSCCRIGGPLHGPQRSSASTKRRDRPQTMACCRGLVLLSGRRLVLAGRQTWESRSLSMQQGPEDRWTTETGTLGNPIRSPKVRNWLTAPLTGKRRALTLRNWARHARHRSLHRG